MVKNQKSKLAYKPALAYVEICQKFINSNSFGSGYAHLNILM